MSDIKKSASKARAKPAKKATGKGNTGGKKPVAKKTSKKQPAKKSSEKKQAAKSNPVDQALTFVAKKFVKKGGTKLLTKIFPYLMFAYFGNKIGYSYRTAEAPDFFNKLMESLTNLGSAFSHIMPSIHPFDLLILRHHIHRYFMALNN